jgi:hypothetical protein
MGASVKTAVVEAQGLATDTMVGGCSGDSGAARPVPDLWNQPPGPVFYVYISYIQYI